MKKVLGLVVVVLLSGVFGGCSGGGSDSDKLTTTSVDSSSNISQGDATQEAQNPSASKHDKSQYIALPSLNDDGYGVIDLDDSKYSSLKRDEGWRVIGDAVMIDVRNMWERNLWREESGELGQPIEAVKDEAIYQFRKNPRGGEEPYNENFPNDVLKIVKDKNKPVVLICHTSGRTSDAVEKLTEAGFSQVYHIKGGMKSWTKHFDTKKHDEL